MKFIKKILKILYVVFCLFCFIINTGASNEYNFLMKISSIFWLINLVIMVPAIYNALESSFLKINKKDLLIVLTGLAIFCWFVSIMTTSRECDHQWIEATCTEPKTCSKCGETEGEALGHDYGIYKIVEESTCISQGTKKAVCERCGEADFKKTGKSAHKIDQYVVTKEATCSETGTKEGVCSVCGQTFTETIEKVSHTVGDWIVISQPTSENNSGVKGLQCAVCGEIMERCAFSLSDEELASNYKAQCQAFTYEQVARNPDDYEGKYAKFTGEVVQVLENNGTYDLRVDITYNGYYYTDTIYVVYESKTSSRILEDDIITIYGQMQGMYTYESVLGSNVTLPIMYAEYVDLVK